MPPNKKAKFGSQISARFTFTNANDIHHAIRNPDVSTALSALRSKLSVKSDEIISPQDERLTLAKLWMESSLAAQDLFDIWGTVRETSTQALVVSLFSSLVTLFSFHLLDHPHGVPIIKMLLSPQWLPKLISYICGSHNELILVTLKLFNAMSMFGSGRERRAIFEAFPWDSKSLPKLLYMRRKGKASEKDDILDRPDIRTYYLLFILSMVERDTASSVKTAFLEQRREVFSSMFKGLTQDRYTVIQKVLQVCWDGVWSDPKINRTTKLGLFSEVTISHLLKLYERSVAEGQRGGQIPADIVHHFLLAICTHPGQGICFRDRGWYPRETEEDTAADQGDEGIRHQGARSGRIYNKILANILPSLKVNEDPRQQELTLKITAACPELVAGYWSSASLTLEPRLSSKWIANISFAGQILSQAVPITGFLLPGSTELYNPTPPPLSIIMANLLPSVGTKALFTKGLQVISTAIVQHCTALVLAKCLRKLSEVLRVFRMVEASLEEDEEEGQWSRRRNEVAREARRRLPEFQVIVAFSQQTLGSLNTTKLALLTESAQRLLWLYQECLPDVVAEARFEVGKLALNLVEGSLASLSGDHESASTEKDVSGEMASKPLQTVKHLHVLRLLSGSDQFGWTGKAASSSHTYLHILLKVFCNSRVAALRTTLKELLKHVLSESVLFQEDPNEVEIWLAALPSHIVRRGQGTSTPDGAPLTDEVDAIITFLDDCVQRCLKTPYRYMEAMLVHVQASPDVHQGYLFASPLLMTVLEQILAKVGGRLMTPSDTLAVFAFLRRLLVMLAAKQEDPEYHNLVAILNQLDSSVAIEQPFPNYPSITFGLKRELSIARTCLCHLQDDTGCHVMEGQSEETLAIFLDGIERAPIPASETARMTSAFKLVDWIRLADVRPSSADISRLASVVQRLYEPALWTFMSYLHPSEGYLWDSGILKPLPDWPTVDGVFDWLFFHCSLPQFSDQRTCDILLTAVFTLPVSFMRLERAVRLIIHGISVSTSRHDLVSALLSLLSDVLGRAKNILDKRDLRHLNERVVQLDTIQELCKSQILAGDVVKAIQKFVSVSFDPVDTEDQILLSPIASHWAEMIKELLSSGLFDELRYAQPWVKFMGTEVLLDVVDLVQANFRQQSTIIRDLLQDILAVLQDRTPQGHSPRIPVPKLFELQSVLPDSAVLENMLLASLVAQLPIGFDGQVAFTQEQSISNILSRATPYCTSNLRSIPFDFISQLLQKESWTDTTGNIIVVLLHVNPVFLPVYVTWLNSKRWTRMRADVFTATLVAFLECTTLTGGDLSQVSETVLLGLLKRLFPDERRDYPAYSQRLESVHRILDLSGARKTRLVSALQECIQGTPIMDFVFEMTFLARKLFKVAGCDDLIASIVDRTLQWAIRHLSGDIAHSQDSIMSLANLKHVATQQKTLKPHLVEPLLITLVQQHLSDACMLELSVVLTNKTPLKPVIVNRLLQTILQHPHFVVVCGKDDSPGRRNQLTRLLDALFRLHPANTCQPSHIEPLFQVYGGTMSSADRRLLSIMRMFEAEKRTSLSAFFARWSPSADASASDALEVVQNFDPVRMLRTCLAFPLWRRFGEEKGARDSSADDSMYDPLMVIVLSAQMLAECPPITPLGWVKVFRSNVVCLLIRCLSSKDPNIRQTALCQIAGVWESVQKSNMHETSQVLYVLQLLKNVVDPPASASGPPRLSTLTTLILLHTLRGTFYPSNFIYPRTARFVLQRPELDVTDVPMLFSMLYSSSDDWKKERGWMLKMLGDGMASTNDWKVLKRRHTWDLIASLFQSAKNDTAVRSAILEILANMTCNVQACTSLVLKSSLLSWIEMQVWDSPSKESVAWLRILENILVVVDIPKLHRAMGDLWCSTMCRCLTFLLQSEDKDLAVLRQCAAVTLRLSLIAGIPSHSLLRVLARATEYLQQLETEIHLRRLEQPVELNVPSMVLPPYRAHELHDVPATAEPLRTWGVTIEALWRANMSFDNGGTPTWAALTRRLLIWRGLVGEEGSPVGEWARKEVVHALHCVTP